MPSGLWLSSPIPLENGMSPMDGILSMQIRRVGLIPVMELELSGPILPDSGILRGEPVHLHTILLDPITRQMETMLLSTILLEVIILDSESTQ